MSQNKKIREIKLTEYAAGVGISNGPAWLLNSYRDLLINQIPFIVYFLILGILLLVSSAIAGYLITKKTGEIYQRAGITTGLLSFIFYFIIIVFSGFGILPLELPLALTCLVIGSGLGAKYFDKFNKL